MLYYTLHLFLHCVAYIVYSVYLYIGALVGSECIRLEVLVISIIH